MNEIFLEPFYMQGSSLNALASLAFSAKLPSAKVLTKYESSKARAIIPVSGVMFRYPNALTGLGYGISTAQLQEQISAALKQNQDVLLVIDSPGGEVKGITSLCDLVASNKERISCFVEGNAASAAFWLASSCGAIYANRAARLGSIGVMASIFDMSKFFENMGVVSKDIVSTLSPNKRHDLSTEQGQDKLRAELDELAELFIQSVAANFKVSKESVVKDFNDGGLILAQKAQELGYVKALGSLDEFIKGDEMKNNVNALSQENSTPQAQAGQADKEKLEALLEYRALLSDDEVKAFKADENATASSIKDFILAKKTQQAKPVSFTSFSVPKDDSQQELRAKITSDALDLMCGLDVKNADHKSHALANKGLKSLLSFNSQLDVLASDGDLMHSMTTSDFPVLLKKSMNRFIFSEFERQPTTFMSLVTLRAKNDFKTETRVARDMISGNVWDNDLVEGGEVRAFSMSEFTYDSKLKSTGSKFHLSRQMLINDDLGAFTDILAGFSQAAAYYINQQVYDLLQKKGRFANFTMQYDKKPIFDKSHNNLLETGSEFGSASLSAARVLLKKQVDRKGNPILLQPKTLIIPTELEFAAEQLLLSTSSTELNHNAGVINLFRKYNLEILSDSMLDDPKAWYLTTQKPIILNYLRQNGGIAPKIEKVKADLVNGIEFQGVLDFSVELDFHQKLVKATGAK